MSSIMKRKSEVLKPMSGGPASIELVNNGNRIIPTKVLIPRKIEINRQSAAREAIGKLVHQGILERVPNDVVTDWISPCSFVSKDGKKLRLVVDFRGLNKYVKRPVHPFPSAMEIVSKIPYGEEINENDGNGNNGIGNNRK